MLAFNPFNMKSDASACATRFTVKSPASYEYSVEIKLLNRQQIMHAIACGYASECIGGDQVRLHAQANNRGDRWHIENIVKEAVAGLPSTGVVDRDAFEHLTELVAVLDLLVTARHQRYSGLNAGENWEDIKRQVFVGNRQLIRNLPAVRKLVKLLLWDDKDRLNQFFENLDNYRQKFPKAESICCTMAVAARLVDFSTTAKLDQSDIKDIVENLSWESSRKDGYTTVLIGKGFPNKMAASEFSMFQAIIRELVIPLRIEYLPKEAQKHLKNTDLLDFPGVANADTNIQQTRINLDKGVEEKFPSNKLFSEVMKRGKTESLVQGYGQSLTIDGFLLMVRAGRFPAKPGQLDAGISSWWRFVDPKYDKRGAPPLPLFIKLTFFADSINDFVAVGKGVKMDPVIDMIEKLGTIADSNVSKLFTSTYKQFPGGGLLLPDGTTAKEVIHDIENCPKFGNRVVPGSIRHTVEDDDGGVGFVLDSILSEIKIGRRHELLRKREGEARDSILAALDEQRFKEDGAVEQVKKDVAMIKAGINRSLNNSDLGEGNPARRVSLRLRQFMDVAPGILPAFPIAGSVKDYRSYLNNCLRRWTDQKRAMDGSAMEEIGMQDPALRVRMSQYLQQRREFDMAAIASWLFSNLSCIKTDQEARQVRLMIACLIQKNLVAYPTQHPSLVEARESMGRWGAGELDKCAETSAPDASPHYAAVIKPFIELIESLLSSLAQLSRAPQLGDEQVNDLYIRAKKIN